MIFALFWFLGVTYEAIHFNFDIKDFIILGLGFSTTIATIFYIPPYLLLSIAEDGVTKHKRELLGNICDNIRSVAPFTIWAGTLTFVFEHCSILAVPYAIVPEIVAIINIIVLIFCPSKDVFR